ncbi:uncharacterized [Tachysurus ichikawai]
MQILPQRGTRECKKRLRDQNAENKEDSEKTVTTQEKDQHIKETPLIVPDLDLFTDGSLTCELGEKTAGWAVRSDTEVLLKGCLQVREPNKQNLKL